MKDSTKQLSGVTVGIDIGDRWSHLCFLDPSGEVVERGKVMTAAIFVESDFRGVQPMRVVLEAGAHSAWMSRTIRALGHEVLVANPRKLRLIYSSTRKNDKADAESLARLGRVDPKLLGPIQHRGEQAQADLALLGVRDGFVRARSNFVSQVRGLVKATGGRLPSCDTASFPKLAKHVSKELWPAVSPLFDIIGELTAKIRVLDRKIERVATKRYPEVERLRQVRGVGPVTSMAFLLTIDDPKRFERSRDVGAYLGMTPRQDQSGDTNKQLGITKAGDPFVRSLLVNCAQYVLGPFGEDCDLKRWGAKLMARGGANSKKRAVIAVARKLAVLLHRLWVSGEVYDKFRQAKRLEAA